jgi:hypothetical protein
MGYFLFIFPDARSIAIPAISIRINPMVMTVSDGTCFSLEVLFSLKIYVTIAGWLAKP